MDARVERTRQSLQHALFALTQEHPFDEVTVNQIVERAGVNRSSFYQHYSDKETLLAFAIEAAADDAGVQLADLDPLSPTPPPALLSYLSHVDANAAVYTSALGPRGSALVAARLRARLNLFVRQGIIDHDPAAPEGLGLDIASASVTGATFGIIEVWLAMTPRPSASTAADWIWQTFTAPHDRSALSTIAE
ncbi:MULTISPECIES: TetR/AcrR family transcriptional regulator [unclassified Salinibacterium]|uniref:TetR/AcrR family transcriptional regulator n=1 Tax=unclassified Salinibacterium TaxID=2632331 RepID=UPI0018CED8AA|nr:MULTISPECIES: TetR/AcrR family transcriptional regulator [unclassified Salinibacterium]MBH0054748.1 TetR/AcrR family transcriptional regulator [Salinibacterium sp. SWN139]MBH0084101.1 TetR/AcrR family transcriptional regulator [Salinibacterium sp. SWN167]